MTPKTPMPYSQIKYDDHRTPGQILSLRSSFAFVSIKKMYLNKLFRVCVHGGILFKCCLSICVSVRKFLFFYLA